MNASTQETKEAISIRVRTSWLLEVLAKTIYAIRIVMGHATFAPAQLLLVNLGNIAVGMEPVRQVVPGQHALMQNASATKDGLELNVKETKVF